MESSDFELMRVARNLSIHLIDVRSPFSTNEGYFFPRVAHLDVLKIMRDLQIPFDESQSAITYFLRREFEGPLSILPSVGMEHVTGYSIQGPNAKVRINDYFNHQVIKGQGIEGIIELAVGYNPRAAYTPALNVPPRAEDYDFTKAYETIKSFEQALFEQVRDKLEKFKQVRDKSEMAEMPMSSS